MSAGGVVYFVLGLLAIGFFYMAYGVIVEEMVSGNMGINDQFENHPELHVSQERMDVAGTVVSYWHWLPVVALIVMFMFAIVIALREHDGNISEGW
jgi:hypothetical protein